MPPTTQFGRRGVVQAPRPAQAYRPASRPGSASFGDGAAMRSNPETSGLSGVLGALAANYCNFHGRTGRGVFWLYMLITITISLCLFAAGQATHSYGLIEIYSLIIVLPDLGIKVRRLHDVGKSGWWFLLTPVPFGAFYLLYLWAKPSQPSNDDLGDVFA